MGPPLRAQMRARITPVISLQRLPICWLSGFLPALTFLEPIEKVENI